MVLLQLFRVLGKYNEFERIDRDQFISVKWENVQSGENAHSLLTYVASVVYHSQVFPYSMHAGPDN